MVLFPEKNEKKGSHNNYVPNWSRNVTLTPKVLLTGAFQDDE